MKDRPVVVVVATIIEDDRRRLMVAPITHSRPEPGEGVPVPPNVSRHLGLDVEQSWIVTTELNRFVWPGPDIRPIKGSDTPLYGAIPAKLFAQVQQEISGNAKVKRAAVVRRTE